MKQEIIAIIFEIWKKIEWPPPPPPPQLTLKRANNQIGNAMINKKAD